MWNGSRPARSTLCLVVRSTFRKMTRGFFRETQKGIQYCTESSKRYVQYMYYRSTVYCIRSLLMKPGRSIKLLTMELPILLILGTERFSTYQISYCNGSGNSNRIRGVPGVLRAPRLERIFGLLWELRTTLAKWWNLTADSPPHL